MRTLLLSLGILLFVVGGSVGAFTLHKQTQSAKDRAIALTGGDPERGKRLAREHGCVACHVFPGVLGPETRVGPPLKQFALSTYVAGVAENSPETVVQFIQDPRSISPRSAMPKLGVSEQDARHLAALLYTFR